MMSSLLPKGYERETFAGMTAHRLDDDRLAELASFVENGLEISGVPGTSVAIIQDGEVVFSGGFGVRELGRPEKVDGDTLYMIASNSKGLTTLLLAKLVDAGKISWKAPVIKTRTLIVTVSNRKQKSPAIWPGFFVAAACAPHVGGHFVAV